MLYNVRCSCPWELVLEQGLGTLLRIPRSCRNELAVSTCLTTIFIGVDLSLFSLHHHTGPQLSFTSRPLRGPSPWSNSLPFYPVPCVWGWGMGGGVGCRVQAENNWEANNLSFEDSTFPSLTRAVPYHTRNAINPYEVRNKMFLRSLYYCKKRIGSCVNQSGFKSYLGPFPAFWPWATYFTQIQRLHL